MTGYNEIRCNNADMHKSGRNFKNLALSVIDQESLSRQKWCIILVSRISQKNVFIIKTQKMYVTSLCMINKLN